MAMAGSTSAVEYLHKKHPVESASLEAGFLAAVTHEWIDIIEFLLSTDEVSAGLFDKAFVLASSRGKLKSVTLLYGKKRASPISIIDALETAGSLAVIKFLYSNEDVSVSSIAAAFTNALRYGPTRETIKSFSSELSEESTRIVCYLYAMNCIPPEAVSDAFQWVVFKIPVDDATAMYTEHSISSAAIGTAFERAVTERRGLALVKFLIDQGSV